MSRTLDAKLLRAAVLIELLADIMELLTEVLHALVFKSDLPALIVFGNGAC